MSDCNCCVSCERKFAANQKCSCMSNKMALCLFVCVSLLTVTIGLSVALQLTKFPGLPSISLLLAEQLWFSVFSAAFFLTWAMGLTWVLTVLSCKPGSNTNNRKTGKVEVLFCCISVGDFLSYSYYVLIYIAVVCIGLILVVKVTEHPTLHYSITGVLIGGWLFSECCLVGGRWAAYNRMGIVPANQLFLLTLNTVCVVLAGIAGTCFGAITMLGSQGEHFQAEFYTNLAFAEYVLIGNFVFFLPIFHCLEIVQPEKESQD